MHGAAGARKEEDGAGELAERGLQAEFVLEQDVAMSAVSNGARAARNRLDQFFRPRLSLHAIDGAPALAYPPAWAGS